MEKDLLKLKSQNDFLAAQKKNYEHEIDSLRQELILALALWTEDSAKGLKVDSLITEPFIDWKLN